MPLAARRVFRLSFAFALALVVGYGLALQPPFMAPLFALMLTATPGSPMGPARLAVTAIALSVILGIGLLVAPMLEYYPISAVLIVGVGVYIANHLALVVGKGGLAAMLTMGLTLISALGTLSSAAAAAIIDALILGIVVAVLCQHVAHALFPEPLVPARPAPPPAQRDRAALTATVIIMPVYLLSLTNPSFYLPIIMKTVSLAQQGSLVRVRAAGRELLGSTFLGGSFAIAIWVALKIWPSLWMFFLWVLLFGVFVASRLYGLVRTRFPPSFWINTAITALILLGSAVQDTENGKDVYQAFAVRLSLFVAVGVYAWIAVILIERWRSRRQRSRCAARGMLERGQA
jgi:hypothetical protein